MKTFSFSLLKATSHEDKTGDSVAFVDEALLTTFDHVKHWRSSWKRKYVEKKKRKEKRNAYVNRHVKILKFFRIKRTSIRIGDHIQKSRYSFIGFVIIFAWKLNPIVNHIGEIFRCDDVFSSEKTLKKNDEMSKTKRFSSNVMNRLMNKIIVMILNSTMHYRRKFSTQNQFGRHLKSNEENFSVENERKSTNVKKIFQLRTSIVDLKRNSIWKTKKITNITKPIDLHFSIVFDVEIRFRKSIYKFPMRFDFLNERSTLSVEILVVWSTIDVVQRFAFATRDETIIHWKRKTSEYSLKTREKRRKRTSLPDRESLI